MLSETLLELSDELSSRALGVKVLSLESPPRSVQAENRKVAQSNTKDHLNRRFIFSYPLIFTITIIQHYAQN